MATSPRKKRCPPVAPGDDELLTTPKKLRTLSYIPPTPTSISRRPTQTQSSDLPSPLHRLLRLQLTLHHGLSHALATSATSPDHDSGTVSNVLNHLFLTTKGFELHDLSRLCWLWEWDKLAVPAPTSPAIEEDENPFVVPKATREPEQKNWQRGAMGIILTPATHFDRDLARRIPVYGIGVQVDMDIHTGLTDGMASIARWTGAAQARKAELLDKLNKWIELHTDKDV